MKEKLEARLQILNSERQNIIGQLTSALSSNMGAIEEVKRLISELEAEVKELVEPILEIPTVIPVEAPVDAPTPFPETGTEAPVQVGGEVVTAAPDENPDATATA